MTWGWGGIMNRGWGGTMTREDTITRAGATQ